jgi:long-chain fatty acid transport protein
MKNTLLATLLIMFSSAAFAGGLYVGEFGQPNMGASGAGAQAIAEDASTAFQNPAGIMFLENKNDVLVTVMAVDSSIKFSVRQPPTSISPATNGGDAGSTMPAGGAFWTRKLGSEDKFGFGLALKKTIPIYRTFDLAHTPKLRNPL